MKKMSKKERDFFEDQMIEEYVTEGQGCRRFLIISLVIVFWVTCLIAAFILGCRLATKIMEP